MHGTLITFCCFITQWVGFCYPNPVLKKCQDPQMFPFENGECYLPTSTDPCVEGEWAIVTNSMLTCEKIPCGPAEVLVGGECRNMFDPAACPAVGERMFVDKHGLGVCDCDDGWGRWEDGRCYQEFTRGFCDENQIIRIQPKDSSCKAKTQDNKFRECVFPFVVKNKLYTGCATEDWPMTLSEEVEGTPWCPMLLYPNKTMKEDNWGLCTESCPVSKDENSFVYKDEIRKRKLLQSSYHIQCDDNPCGDPRISLPHRSTWTEGPTVCHPVRHTLQACEVFVDSDNNLMCCDAENALKCEVGDINQIQLFRVVKSCIGEDSCRCNDGYIWSEFRLQCVQLFRGARPTLATTNTEPKAETTTAGITINDDTTTIDNISTLMDDNSTTTQSLEVTTNLSPDLENF
eukprot:GFUD01051593.1.p1 GENE.GFUD01051593.1~~GFUD01051593.1.p1  ORF type:complete len:402 (-),score=77.03 GFUD01051593.1:88-1293(-)